MNSHGSKCSANDLRALLLDGSPHQLHKLQYLCMESMSLFDAHMDALVALPNLTTLRPSLMHPAIFPRLAAFTQLRQLRIRPANPLLPLHSNALLESLHQMRVLRVLELVDFEFKDEDDGWSPLLSGLADAVPLLQKLCLRRCSELPPLPPLTALSHLRWFDLECCTFVSAADSAAGLPSLLSAWQQLESLRITSTDRQPLLLSEEQRARFTPPSALLPTLRIFEWD